jgi:hypothetical protein
VKKPWCFGIVVLLAALGGTSPAAAQGELDRLESDIRISSGPPAVPAAAAQRVYLGARADNDMGGVRVLSVASGGPAERSGLKPRDLIVGAAGRKIRSLSELSAILGGLKPGDRLSLELIRGTQPLRTEVVVAALPGAPQPGQPGIPPLPGLGAGRTEGIPPPPGEVAPVPLPEGPAIALPGAEPTAPSGPQAQIEELRRRVDQLERRVQELERALAESQRVKTSPANH